MVINSLPPVLQYDASLRTFEFGWRFGHSQNDAILSSLPIFALYFGRPA